MKKQRLHHRHACTAFTLRDIVKVGLSLPFIGAYVAGLFLLVSLNSYAEPSVDSLRLWRAPDNTRLVFDLDSAMSHSVFELNNPSRLVIDLPKSSFRADLKSIDTKGTPILGIRTGKRQDGGLRVVLDLSKPVKPRSFSLAPNETYGDRLVLDLYDQNERTEKTVDDLAEKNRDIIIAIDAGHGSQRPVAPSS